jgi:hypothetical protein
MSLIDIDDFKAVLGVGDIYSDATLEGVMDSAELVLKSFLNLHRASIVAVELKDNVARLWTRTEHGYSVGQQVDIDRVGSPFNGTRTITRVFRDQFQASITSADVTYRINKPDGNCLLNGQETYFDDIPQIREAALMIAVDLWNARQTAQGIASDATFAPGIPYRMGRSLVSRVAGLISGYRDPSSMVG